MAVESGIRIFAGKGWEDTDIGADAAEACKREMLRYAFTAYGGAKLR
ncbi:hypothetical protein [Stomatobaculum longum]|nr:hypothetical protein [Stomatobaculum longum]